MEIKNDCRIPEPVNAQERYLYAMVVRLDALCHMTSSLLEYIAKKEGIAVQENTVVEQVEVKKEEAPKRPARKRKS